MREFDHSIFNFIQRSFCRYAQRFVRTLIRPPPLFASRPPKREEILDCRWCRIFRDLDSDLVEELYKRQIRYSVGLPFFGWVDNFPEPLRATLMERTQGTGLGRGNAKGLPILMSKCRGTDMTTSKCCNPCEPATNFVSSSS
jgi:hypothetical protein